MTEKLNLHSYTFHNTEAGQRRVVDSWPVVEHDEGEISFAGTSRMADEMILFYTYLLTLLLLEKPKTLFLTNSIYLFPSEASGNLTAKLHPKCNHSQLQAWGCKHCCSCIRVNYLKAFQFQKLCGSLRVEQSEPHMISEDIWCLYANFCVKEEPYQENNRQHPACKPEFKKSRPIFKFSSQIEMVYVTSIFSYIQNHSHTFV